MTGILRSSGRLVTWSLMIGFGAAPGAAAQTPAVAVRVSVDRTAVWVADRIAYTIEIACKRGVDIVTDDLSREKLTLEGLEVVSSESSTESARDAATIHRFGYVLTTYRVDVPALTIAPLTVRYYVKRSGRQPEETAPAGVVRVPGAVIAFRSLLLDEQDVSGLRADRSALPRPVLFEVLEPVGIGLVLASIAPVMFAAAAAVGRRRRRRPLRSVRAVRHEERTSMDAVRTIDVSTIDGRREAFTRLNVLVREHLRDVCGVPAPGLTPVEIALALSARDARVGVELVTSVLTACELARYAPPHAAPSADACRDAIAQVEQIIGGA